MIWIKGPQLIDRDYLKDRNNAEYKPQIKTLDCRIGRFHWSDLGGTTNEMLGFRIFQIVTICRRRALIYMIVMTEGSISWNIIYKQNLIGRNLENLPKNDNILCQIPRKIISKYLLKIHLRCY